MWVGGRVVRRRGEDSTWRRDPPSLSPQAGEGEPACEAAEAAAGGGGRGGVQGPGRSPEAAARAGGCHRVCRVHEPGGDHAEEPAPVRLPRICVPSLHQALLPHLTLSLHPPYPSVPVPPALSLSLSVISLPTSLHFSLSHLPCPNFIFSLHIPYFSLFSLPPSFNHCLPVSPPPADVGPSPSPPAPFARSSGWRRV